MITKNVVVGKNAVNINLLVALIDKGSWRGLGGYSRCRDSRPLGTIIRGQRLSFGLTDLTSFVCWQATGRFNNLNLGSEDSPARRLVRWIQNRTFGRWILLKLHFGQDLSIQSRSSPCIDSGNKDVSDSRISRLGYELGRLNYNVSPIFKLPISPGFKQRLIHRGPLSIREDRVNAGD